MRFFVVIVLLFAATANANIRGPYMLDGSFSEHMRGTHPAAVLLRERFVARMPSLIAGEGEGFEQTRALFARVEVEYDIENTSPARQTITIPVRFLAVGAEHASIQVNGAHVPFAAVVDAQDRLAARARIAQHRCAWSASADEHDLGGRQLHPGDCTLDDIEHAQRVDDWRRRHHHRADGDVRVDSLAFDVVLAPGENTVRVAYDQQLRFKEGAYGYLSGLGIRGSRYGFEYLLYPAESWARSESFTFDVFIDVPDVRERGWLSDSFLESTVFTNLPLDPVRQPHPGTTVSGRLRGFPSDILAVVVVVPPGGMRLF